MKVSRETMARNRDLIMDQASRLFRAHGYDAVSVAQVMQAAGLTHGGFYGHFTSKDDLYAKSLAHGLSARAEVRAGMGLDALREIYLSQTHRADRGGGCLVAGLASETGRQDGPARDIMTEAIRRQLGQIADALGQDGHSDARQAAIGQWAAMVGAVILARASSDADLSDEILTGTRAWLEQGPVARDNRPVKG